MYEYTYKGKTFYFVVIDGRLTLKYLPQPWIDYVPKFPTKISFPEFVESSIIVSIADIINSNPMTANADSIIKKSSS